MSLLACSLIASIVLTVALNIALRMFPDTAARLRDQLSRRGEPAPDGPQRSRVRVIFPWKAMLIGSLLLTVLINVVLLARR